MPVLGRREIVRALSGTVKVDRSARYGDLEEVTAIDEWAKWTAVDFGGEPRTILWRSFRTAAHRHRKVLTTADVLALASRLGSGIPRGAVGRRQVERPGAVELMAAAPAAQPNGAGEPVTTASVMALREARWRGARRAHTSPAWSSALVAALDHALADARSRGLSYVNDVHLILGLLADRDNTASRLLAQGGVNRRDLVQRLRRSAEVNRSGTAWTPLVRTLEAFGVLRGPDLATRAVGQVGRVMARLGGHGQSLLAAFPQEISRQAVLLGDTQLSTAHVVLAVADLDRQLAAAGSRLPEAIAVNNTGGAILAEHGLRYEAAIRSRPELTPSEAVATHVARGLWPALRNGDPTWGQVVVDLLAAARADAAARGHRDGGTTHLLALTLAAAPHPTHEANAAVRWLDGVGVKVDAVRNDLERDLERDPGHAATRRDA